MSEHIRAKKDDICKTVIMPGDPMRAKFIAENFLSDYKLVNDVRGMYAYTGKYKDKLVTVMAHGMGNASMGIYSYELFHDYDVDNIIRIGTAGAYDSKINVRDILVVKDAWSESSYARTQNGFEEDIISSSAYLTNHILNVSNDLGEKVLYGRVHSSDVFYKENDNYLDILDKYGCLACEMESFALFHNAHVLGKNASCILTISNSLATGDSTTSDEREKTLTKMITLALESAYRL